MSSLLEAKNYEQTGHQAHVEPFDGIMGPAGPGDGNNTPSVMVFRTSLVTLSQAMTSDYESTRISLAANLVRLRAQRGWSQQMAAEAAEIDLKHFQKLEYSSINPSLRTLVSVARAFGVPVGHLLRWARPLAKRPVGRPPGSSRKR